ncbi:hypothetical protein Z517_07753 [Fonsecaea pedrosoi CBS 271.37]|uniref:Uncharacterized protein n=1 Tax=Fonsecaea pedrosoi CBS 271.37 TaxID=1442368 RepID=A0A0D2GH64_9EURO|nr:uncharacterized protein Z517_07753 [Fonsecaea pedrosoi CBS 271.37]KIW77920.1 hypothetical protein Z517_07753 [Fonsecaea pedrosoi CBS 271.37]
MSPRPPTSTSAGQAEHYTSRVVISNIDPGNMARIQLQGGPPVLRSLSNYDPAMSMTLDNQRRRVWRQQQGRIDRKAQQTRQNEEQNEE